MRTETCACGGSITAPSLAVSAPYVEAHGLSAVHRAWRAGAVVGDIALELISSRPPTYRDPRRPTALTLVVTCPTAPGASAVEGAE